MLSFGTGLIGGSFALALKEAGAVEEVVGFGRTPATLRSAQQLGVIDRAGINPNHEIEDADIILVATPVRPDAGDFQPHCALSRAEYHRYRWWFGPREMLSPLRAPPLVTESASLFRAHPIAGAENSGPSAARYDLLKASRLCYALPENSDDSLDHIKRAWSLCGADIYS